MKSVHYPVMRQTERDAAWLVAHIDGLLNERLWRVARSLMHQRQQDALNVFVRVIRQPWAIRVFK